jgi:hypothetical protein
MSAVNAPAPLTGSLMNEFDIELDPVSPTSSQEELRRIEEEEQKLKQEKKRP